MAKFQKGQSGNPNGRPPKNRALTDLLEAAGNVTIERNGKKTARKRVIASLAWELLTEGKATLPTGETLKLDPQDWLGLYKWIYTHIDGPPKAEFDVTSAGEQIGEIGVKLVDYRIGIADAENGSGENNSAPSKDKNTGDGA